MATSDRPWLADSLNLGQLIAKIIDPQCWDPDLDHKLTHNMCHRREDSTAKAAAILALIQELV